MFSALSPCRVWSSGSPNWRRGWQSWSSGVRSDDDVRHRSYAPCSRWSERSEIWQTHGPVPCAAVAAGLLITFAMTTLLCNGHAACDDEWKPFPSSHNAMPTGQGLPTSVPFVVGVNNSHGLDGEPGVGCVHRGLPLCHLLEVCGKKPCEGPLLGLPQVWCSSLFLKCGLMGTISRYLLGFIGMGRGPIFSPYLLLMRLELAVMVATALTCVIFPFNHVAVSADKSCHHALEGARDNQLGVFILGNFIDATGFRREDASNERKDRGPRQTRRPTPSNAMTYVCAALLAENKSGTFEGVHCAYLPLRVQGPK